MSKKINSVVCPKCQKPLMRIVSGTSGYIFVHCDNCGSSVKIRADREHISTDAVSGTTEAESKRT